MDPVGELRNVLSNMKNIVDGLGSDLAADMGCYDHLDIEPTNRIMHLKSNPFSRIIDQEEAEYAALKKENERLRARLSLIETGNDPNVTMRIDEAVNNAHQIEMLTQQVSEFKEREEKILSSLKKTAGQFREACFSLIGYRVDALKDNIYRLSHRYANNDDEKLFFEVKRDGTIKLLENEYSKRLSQHVSTYVASSDSFPAFLAALTLDLFKASNTTLDVTQTMDMSMSMSTTMLANPRYSRDS